MAKPPFPPFNHETATLKVRMAEDAWNGRDPQKVSMAYCEDSQWRNRDEIFTGRAAIVEFLTRKWACESEYRLAKQLWAYSDNRIAVRFQYEYKDADGNWHRAYGNENWEFDDQGYMSRREASINDRPIAAAERKFLWTQKIRPHDHPGVGDEVQ